MITRKELLESHEFWMAKIQTDLFNKVEEYIKEKKINRTQLAEELKVTKGYVSQVLNGDFNGRLSKLVELSLAIGTVPLIDFHDKEDFIEMDSCGYNMINHGEPYAVKFEIKVENDIIIEKGESNNIEPRDKVFNFTDQPIEMTYEPILM